MKKLELAKIELRDRETLLDVLDTVISMAENNKEIYSLNEECNEYDQRYAKAWDTVVKHLEKLI